MGELYVCRGREGGRLVVNAMPVIWVVRAIEQVVMGFHVCGCGENLFTEFRKVAQADS